MSEPCTKVSELQAKGTQDPRLDEVVAMRRGIAALLGRRDQSGAAATRPSGIIVEEVPVSAIRLSPYQARNAFDEQDIEALTKSVREYGVLQPILVRKVNAGIELIAGERRVRAAKRAGIEKVPAVIMELRDQDAAVVSLSENIQRRNLTYLEQARGYRRIIDQFGCSQAELARALGVSESLVGARLRLLSLGDELLAKVDAEHTLEGHLEAILRLPDPKTRLMVLEDVQARRLSVKQTEALVDRVLSLRKRQNVIKILPDARLLLNSIRKAVKDMEQSGVGIEYSQSVDEDWIDVRIRIANTKGTKADLDQ
jgi:ParB family chromosome partitioning protein